MKSIKAAALIMSLCIAGAALCACNNQPEPVSSDINVIATQSQNSGIAGTGESSSIVAGNAASADFSYKGTVFATGTEVDLSKFVENSDYTLIESENCASADGELGWEITFNGGSVLVEATPVDGKYIIKSITVSDDTVPTPEGIYVGYTVDQVKATYGEPGADTGEALIYNLNGHILQFEYKNDTVSKILYHDN